MSELIIGLLHVWLICGGIVAGLLWAAASIVQVMGAIERTLHAARVRDAAATRRGLLAVALAPFWPFRVAGFVLWLVADVLHVAFGGVE